MNSDLIFQLLRFHSIPYNLPHTPAIDQWEPL